MSVTPARYLPYLAYIGLKVYKTKDGQFFHLHGSLSPSATLRLINVNPDHPTEKDAEARDIIQAACLHYTADELRQLYTDAGLVGDIVLKPEEFDASEQVRRFHFYFVSLPDRILGQNSWSSSSRKVHPNREQRTIRTHFSSPSSAEYKFQATRRS